MNTIKLAAAFAVDVNTLQTWVGLGRLGRRDGKRRVFSHDETFAIGLLAALSKIGVPVNHSAIESARILAEMRNRPATFRVRESGGAVIEFDVRAAERLISDNLAAVAADKKSTKL